MENPIFDLSEPKFSYMFGFMQADGHLSSEERGRGKMTIELSERDSHILESFKEIISVNSTLTSRKRDTNFKKNTITCSLIVYDKLFRDTLNFYGIPNGKKSDKIKPSLYSYSKYDYWRGIIDADGSIGITNKNKPFISLVTASEELSNAFSDFIYDMTDFRPNINRNKRDNVFNITITNEKSQKIVSLLYYKDCLSLNRKKEISKKIIDWVRPENMKSRPQKRLSWNCKEKEFLINNTLENCLLIFKDRKKTSIVAMRNGLLKKKK